MIDTTTLAGGQKKASADITQSMSHVMADRVQSSYIPSVSARLAMASDECYEAVSSPGADLEEAYSRPLHSLEPEKEFILKYQSLPQLWDTSDIRYSNRFERYQALANLLPIYQKMKPYGTIDDIKKKINSLRSNFRRELKKYSSDNPGGYYPKVWYFPYLSFLRKLEGGDDKGEGTAKVERTERPEHIQIDRPQVEMKPSILRSLCSESEQSTPHPPLKIRKKIFRTEVTNQHRPQPYQHQHPCQKISNPLALEWSETLARLDPLQKLYAKKAINDVLFEAELGNLHKNSVRINEESDAPPNYSTQQSDPISIQSNDSTTDQDYKYPIEYLHCNLENDSQDTKETEYSD